MVFRSEADITWGALIAGGAALLLAMAFAVEALLAFALSLGAGFAVRLLGRAIMRRRKAVPAPTSAALEALATRGQFFVEIAGTPRAQGAVLRVDVLGLDPLTALEGPAVAQDALGRVAQVLEGCIGTEDRMCRFGPASFAIYLQNATEGSARNVARVIAIRIGQGRLGWSGASRTLSLRIGCASLPAPEALDAALSEAETRLTTPVIPSFKRRRKRAEGRAA